MKVWATPRFWASSSPITHNVAGRSEIAMVSGMRR